MTIWDCTLAALVLVFFSTLAWLLVWPHGQDRLPDELLEDEDP